MGGGGGAGPSVSVAEPPIERKRGPTDMGVDARAAAKPRVEVKEEGKEEEKNGSTQPKNGQEGRGRQEERGGGGGAAAAGGGGGADGAEEALNEEIRAVVAELVDTRNEDPHMNTAVTALLKVRIPLSLMFMTKGPSVPYIPVHGASAAAWVIVSPCLSFSCLVPTVPPPFKSTRHLIARSGDIGSTQECSRGDD